MLKRYAHMTGWGKYVPERILTNADLEKMVDTSDEWIMQRTGIRERRIAGPDDLTSTMSVAAAQEALQMAHVRPSDIDLIIVATSTPDYYAPAVSSMVQDMLGATCPAFTLMVGCTGWVYGMATASQFIETGMYDTVVVVGAELISPFLDYNDRGTCVLFGDGAGAAVLQATDDPAKSGILAFELGSDGALHEHIIMRGLGSRHRNPHQSLNGVLDDEVHYLEMNGREVFKFATRVAGRSIINVLDEAGLTQDDIDLFIPHQANYRIIQAAARFMKVPIEKFMVTIDRYGNNSAASIPIALYDAIAEERCKPGDTLAFVAFGAGLTWASMVMQLGAPLGQAAQVPAPNGAEVNS